MDLNIIIGGAGLAFTVASVVGGYYNAQLTKVKEGADQVRRDLDLYKLHVAETYIKQAEFKEALRELKEVFHRELQEHNNKIGALFQKLDKIIDLKLMEDA